MIKIVFVLLVVATIFTACSSAKPTEYVPSCLEAKITTCNGSFPEGTIINSCSRNVWMAKLIIVGLDSSEEVIASDEEYVESLSAGDQARFEAAFDDDYGNKVKSCKVTIESAVFK